MTDIDLEPISNYRLQYMFVYCKTRPVSSFRGQYLYKASHWKLLLFFIVRLHFWVQVVRTGIWKTGARVYWCMAREMTLKQDMGTYLVFHYETRDIFAFWLAYFFIRVWCSLQHKHMDPKYDNTTYILSGWWIDFGIWQYSHKHMDPKYDNTAYILSGWWIDFGILLIVSL